MFRTVLRRIGLWFDEAQPETVAAADYGAMSRHRNKDAFAARLAEANTGKVVVGAFEMLDLTDVRASFGADWSQTAGQVNRIMAEELEAGLADGDTFHKVGELTFVVCFADNDPGRSSVRADAIAARIRERLAEELPTTVDRIGIGRQVAEVETSELLQSGDAAADTLLARLQNIREESRQAHRQINSALINDTRVLFQPCWRRSTSAIALNRVVIDPVIGRSILHQVQGLSDPETSQHMLAGLDFAVYTKAVGAVHAAARRQQQVAPVVVPVQQSTLISPEYLGQYLDLLDTIPDAYRSMIYVEALSSPRSGAVEPLTEALHAIRKRVGRVLLRVLPGQDRLVWMTANHLWGVTIDLSDYHNRKGPLPVTQLMRAAETLNVRVIALGANTLAAVQAADDAQIDFIAGGAVHLVSDVPKPIGRYNPFVGLGDGGGRREPGKSTDDILAEGGKVAGSAAPPPGLIVGSGY